MDIVNQYLSNDNKVSFFQNLNLDQQVKIVKSLNKEQLKQIIPELSFGAVERILRELNTSLKAELYSILPDSMLQSIYRNASLDDKNQMFAVMEERQANNLKIMNDYDQAIANSSNNIIRQKNSIQQSKLNIDSAKINRIQARDDIEINNIKLEQEMISKKKLSKKIARLSKKAHVGLFRKSKLEKLARRTEELEAVINEINRLNASNEKLNIDIQKYTNQIEQEKINIQNVKEAIKQSKNDIKENSKKSKEQGNLISKLNKQQKHIFGRRIFHKNVYLRGALLGKINKGELKLLDENLQRNAISTVLDSNKDEKVIRDNFDISEANINVNDVLGEWVNDKVPKFESETEEWSKMVKAAFDANAAFDKKNVAKKQLEDAINNGKSVEEIKELRSNLAKLNGAFGYQIRNTNEYFNKYNEYLGIEYANDISYKKKVNKNNKDSKKEIVLDSEVAKNHLKNMLDYSKQAGKIISDDRSKYGEPGKNKDVEFVEVVNIRDGHKKGEFRKIKISKDSLEKYQEVLNQYKKEQEQIVELMRADTIKKRPENNDKIGNAFVKINKIFNELSNNGVELVDKHKNLNFSGAYGYLAHINKEDRDILKVVIAEVKKKMIADIENKLTQNQSNGHSRTLYNPNTNGGVVSVSILVMVLSALITFVGLMLLLRK